MIDIGFWELTLSGLVALIILGPQRLPELARTLGTLLRHAQAITAKIKHELNEEIQIEETSYNDKKKHVDRSVLDKEKI